jgi:HEAT repeat protein
MLRNALLWISATVLASTSPLAQVDRIDSLVAELGDRQTSLSATEALVRIGEPAVPALRRALSADAPTPTVTAALVTLGKMRGDAIAAIPDFLVGLRMGPDRTSALWALGEVGPYSPDRLRLADQIPTALGSSARFFSPEVTRALSRLTMDPGSNLEELDAELDRGNPRTWEFVAEILERRRDRDSVPLLLRILETDRLPPGQRSSTGPAGNRFQMSFGSGGITDEARRTASRALIQIAPERPQAIPAYLILLAGNDLEQRRDAAMALGRQGARAAEAVLPLLRATRDPDLRIAREAITALGMIGTAATPAIPAMERLSGHEDAQISQRARVALRQIRRDSDRV